jgi:hypothetical protein
MASEQEANIARKKFEKQLHDRGAHALTVDTVSDADKKSFAVIAFFDDKTQVLKQDDLEITIGKRKQKVPLIFRHIPKFQAE